MKPTTKDIDPDFIESFPRSGPTVLSSTIKIGVGKAPDLNSNARSVASWKVKLPDIVPLPPVIDSLITGALITLSSKTMANLLPTFFVVTLPNFCAPNLSKVKDTIVSLLWLSTLGCASNKLSPK